MQSGSSSPLVESLRSTINPSAVPTSDSRFLFGTEVSSNYVKFGQEAYNYKPLPAKFPEPNPHLSIRRHVVHPNVNPRLNAYSDEVKTLVVPVHDKLTETWKRLDIPDSGYLNQELIESGLRETGVLLSKEDVGALLQLAPRNIHGEVNYFELLDAIVDKATTVPLGTLNATVPKLPEEFGWSGQEPLIVSLRLHATIEPFPVPASNMARYAKELTDIAKREPNPEKVYNLMRHFLLQDLLISPGRPGHPDLSFRQWLMHNGILARTMSNSPGVIPPEVYEVFNQIIAALGLPMVNSATMTATDLGASLRHTSRIGPAPA